MDNEGNICKLRFDTTLARVDELATIATLVRDGSWIKVYDHDADDIFRYVFRNGVIVKEYPTISIGWEAGHLPLVT